MILNGFVLYNRKTNQYNTPTFVPYDKDQFVEHVDCQVKMATGVDAQIFSESDLFYVGTFDTKTCEASFKKKPVFLKSYGGADNVKCQSN